MFKAQGETLYEGDTCLGRGMRYACFNQNRNRFRHFPAAQPGFTSGSRETRRRKRRGLVKNTTRPVGISSRALCVIIAKRLAAYCQNVWPCPLSTFCDLRRGHMRAACLLRCHPETFGS